MTEAPITVDHLIGSTAILLSAGSLLFGILASRQKTQGQALDELAVEVAEVKASVETSKAELRGRIEVQIEHAKATNGRVDRLEERKQVEENFMQQMRRLNEQQLMLTNEMRRERGLPVLSLEG
tara:strand:- start:39 stop:410 length:372 start_codon:yes stop_codon:yes gene_type:complete